MKHRSSLKMIRAPPPVGVPARGWGGGRTLLVAVRRDAAGRELLAWALAKAAAAGDRVVALHVTTADVSGMEEKSGAAADSLASVLAAYDGFCNLNQVQLDFTPGHPENSLFLQPL
jgi:fructoselysine-6-P-deglycase FrlB-like protein